MGDFTNRHTFLPRGKEIPQGDLSLGIIPERCFGHRFGDLEREKLGPLGQANPGRTEPEHGVPTRVGWNASLCLRYRIAGFRQATEFNQKTRVPLAPQCVLRPVRDCLPVCVEGLISWNRFGPTPVVRPVVKDV